MNETKHINYHFNIAKVADSYVVRGKDEAVFTGEGAKEKAINFVKEKIEETLTELN